MAKKSGNRSLSILTTEMQFEMERIESLWKDMEAVNFDKPLSDQDRLNDRRLHSIWNIKKQEVQSIRYVIVDSNAQLNTPECKAVVIKPMKETTGSIFYIHGGGWSLCDLVTHEGLMRALANASNKNVIAIEYRLAPQHPFPEGLLDLVAAYRAILDTPEKYGLGCGPVVIAGDSAGANLALAVMLHEQKFQRPLPVGALLFYGCFGLDFETPSYKTFSEGYLLTRDIMQQLWNWYLPKAEDRFDPLAVPLLAKDSQLISLPPMFLSTGEVDPLASDSLLLKDRLDAIGREDQLWIEKGTVHGYMEMVFQLEASRRTHEKAGIAVNMFIDKALRGR
ncbi:alpha/beta hydrolase [Alteromonas mediterranea]|uniref:alpha/beta hydrolase n=1 Tax=Alteromonas mediterranea TaxID=314275 RepID=UPI0024203B44|nr:alpha/beta hydrolase [Alteromonas mediterranea]